MEDMMEDHMSEVCNYMEIFVEQAMPPIMKEMNMCECDLCKMDVKAIALNALPPKYVVTDRGMMYSKLQKFEPQFNTDVMLAVTKACSIVGENPRHEKAEEDNAE